MGLLDPTLLRDFYRAHPYCPGKTPGGVRWGGGTVTVPLCLQCPPPSPLSLQVQCIPLDDSAEAHRERTCAHYPPATSPWLCAESSPVRPCHYCGSYSFSAFLSVPPCTIGPVTPRVLTPVLQYSFRELSCLSSLLTTSRSYQQPRHPALLLFLSADDLPHSALSHAK